MMAKHPLVPDLKPTPIKDRSSLGKAEIFIDSNTAVTAVGVVFGIEHRIEEESYRATLFLDHYNQRIRILSYKGPDYHNLVLRVRMIAEKNGFDKIICMAKRKDWQEFLKHGYVLEAVLKYYHAGEDAFVVSKFRSQERILSPSLMEETLLIEQIMSEPAHGDSHPLPEGMKLRMAVRTDIPALIALYSKIFESYPSPLCHSDYLEHVFGKETFFAVITQGDRIISAASGEIAAEEKAVELTDCATEPEFRGRGLMSILLRHLEVEFQKKGFHCAYTLARSKSFGMNNCFYQLGFEFLGRLVNNCDIYGAYEDMNLWVKPLK